MYWANQTNCTYLGQKNPDDVLKNIHNPCSFCRADCFFHNTWSKRRTVRYLIKLTLPESGKENNPVGVSGKTGMAYGIFL